MIKASIHQHGKLLLERQFPEDLFLDVVCKRLEKYVELEALNDEGPCDLRVWFPKPSELLKTAS